MKIGIQIVRSSGFRLEFTPDLIRGWNDKDNVLPRIHSGAYRQCKPVSDGRSRHKAGTV